MQLTTALAIANGYAPNSEDIGKLSDILEPDLIDEAFDRAGVGTVRKRRLPLDMVLWSIIGNSKENQQAFTKSSNQFGEQYPQVRMVFQMELTSHLLTGSHFDCASTNEMVLADYVSETRMRC